MATERGRFPAFAHRDFKLLWSANVVSRLGSQMRDVAITWQIYLLTRSPLALGLIGACRVVPIVLLSLGAGAAADAFDRRRILLATQGVFATVSTTLAVSTWLGWTTAPLLYAAVAVIAAAAAFDGAARQSLITNVLPEEDLPNGLTLAILGLHISSVIGPGAGGMLLAETSIQAIYAIDATSYVFVIAALLVIRPRSEGGEVRARMSVEAVVEALRFLREKPILMWLMGLDFAATFFAGSLLLLPIFADEIFAVGPHGLGWMLSAPSAGALLASIWLSWRPPIRRYGVAMLGAVMAYGATTAAFGVTTSFPLALLLLAGSGAADTVSTVVRQVVRQTLTPNAMRGRMTGVNMIFFVGGPQLGEVEAGVVAKLAGTRMSVVSGGILCMVIAAMAGLVPAIRGLRAEERGGARQAG